MNKNNEFRLDSIFKQLLFCCAEVRTSHCQCVKV